MTTTPEELAAERAADTMALEQELTDHGADTHVTATGVSNEKLAMWAFLGSECLLSGALISTYRGRSVVAGRTGSAGVGAGCGHDKRRRQAGRHATARAQSPRRRDAQDGASSRHR